MSDAVSSQRSIRARPAEVMEGERPKPWPPQRRWLTVHNVFFAVLVLALAFLVARRQGLLLPAPDAAAAPPAARGAEAPGFVLPDLRGAPVHLVHQRGKVVLINFWATWCPPCRAEMPSMERLYRAYRERGLTILAVAMSEPESAVRPFVQERGLTFPVLLDGDGGVAARYGVRGIPVSYLLDRQGRVVSAETGARDWSGTAARDMVERLLAEP